MSVLTASATTSSTTSAPGKTSGKFFGKLGYIALAAVLVIFTLGSPYFLTYGNIITILTQASVFAVAGVGLAIVIICGGDDVLSGGIDLSSGAVAGLSGAVTAVLTVSGANTFLAILGGFGTALVIGLINGASVLLGLRPLLATLATMGIATSLELVVSNNIKVVAEGSLFVALREGTFLGLPLSAWTLLLVGAVSWAIYSRSSWGINSYAVGQNPTAATVAGISVNKYRFSSYLISSLLAGVAGVLLISRLSAAVPGIGGQILLDIILVSYMSIIFSNRLLVSVPGTVLAAIFVAALSNGLTLIGVESQWVGAAKGLLILVVLASVTLKGRSAK
ncbi:ribose transport system permease protein [Neomicrococcus aestuarii]|uniref:Ribose transport system permease protein n=1 Tax=Neomicrococcus aestuarii TaxID=556325 RepID=A0A7W8WZE9_9MICC|nr:ABC transporter permease [Neomicrococcus aestuarii]MBB5512240.1 ribose transport system permease protein [Neomicrococcus aestuarii]